jgi:hypothetical protein
MKKILFYILFLLVFAGCKKPNETAFYFWKTTYKINAYEKDFLDKLQVKKLYVRFFDIDLKENQPVPVGEIDIQEKNTTQEIIPVIFITNETFKYLDKTAIAQLADNTLQEIKFIYPKISDQKIKEIQFDCDWTVTTRNKYFYFINLMKALAPEMIFSATIRLHQIKYKNTAGVPTAHKGVLMYYATDNPLKATDKNSILDNEEAAKYIKNINQYPIHLDIAMPIYSWAIIENELGEKRLVNGIREDDLQDTSLYFKTEESSFIIKKEHTLNGLYVQQDFKIKTEEITTDDLLLAKKHILSKLKNKELTTIFYQLDSSNLKHYSINELNAISK